MSKSKKNVLYNEIDKYEYQLKLIKEFKKNKGFMMKISVGSCDELNIESNELKSEIIDIIQKHKAKELKTVCYEL